MPFKIAKVLLLLLVVLGIARDAVRPVQEFDIWLHLAAGARIAATNAIPYFDDYSFTAQGARWVYHEWLFALFVHHLDDACGLLALNILPGLLLGGVAVALLALFGQVAPPSPWRVPGAIAWLVAGNALLAIRFHLRPQQVSLLFLALELFILYRGGAWRWLFLLLFPLWANVHGDVLLGVAVLGLWGWCRMLADRAGGRRWLLAAAGALLLTMLNPYGWRLWDMAWRIGGYAEFQASIVEWMPLPPEAGAQVLPPALLLLAVAAWLARGRGRWFELTLAMLGILALLKAARYAPLVVIFGAPLFACALAELPRRLAPRRLWGPLGLLAAAALVFLFLQAWSGRHSGFGVRERYFPFPAFAFINEHALHGRTLADYAYATAFTTCNLPGNPFFIDGRWDVYGEDILRRYGQAMEGGDWREVVDGDSINVILLAAMPYDFRVAPYPPLAAALARDAQWGLVFWDDVSLLFVRRSAFPQFVGFYEQAWPVVVREGMPVHPDSSYRIAIAKALAQSPAHTWAYQTGALMAEAAGDTAQAMYWYESGLNETPRNGVLLTDYAACLMRQDMDSAAAIALQLAMQLEPDYYLPYYLYGRQTRKTSLLKRALALRPDLIMTRLELANENIRRGQPEKAQELMAEAPLGDDARGLLLLAGFWQAQGDFARAIPPLQRYLIRWPQQHQAWLALATCYSRTKRYDEARAVFVQLEAAGESGPVFYADYGAALIECGDWANAARQLDRALAADPEMAAAKYNRDIVRQQLGDTDRVRLY